MERLGDSRADAAYSRALALRPQDPLLALNMAGRYARASRLPEAVSAAAHAAQLLDSNPHPQVGPQSQTSLGFNTLRVSLFILNARDWMI